MLPPLLSLLLDCAKKTDQTVVSISLGALVHLIEVGGHQFSESDWDMLLKSIRCKFFPYFVKIHYSYYYSRIWLCDLGNQRERKRDREEERIVNSRVKDDSHS